MATIRAVVDTNALFPRRQRELLQQLAFNSAFIAIWSPYIISELYRVLTWDQIKRTVEGIEDIPGVRRKTYDVSEAKRRHVSLSAKKMMEVFLRNPNWLLVEARPPYPRQMSGTIQSMPLPWRVGPRMSSQRIWRRGMPPIKM